MDDIKNKIYKLVKPLDSDGYNINIDILADTLYYRLTILRLGEEDNNGWWESIILGEVGRRNLEKFFPNTFSSQRYDIATKIINQKENREITENEFTTLFNFGYEFETQVFKPFVKEISKLDGWEDILKGIEEIKAKKINIGWVRELYDISELPDDKLSNEKTIELGKISRTFYNDKNSFEDAIKSFLSIYNICTQGNLKTGYYIRKMVI